ncbi:MAG: methyltransferase domain-containing protein [Anaerolineales bacterium]|nr:methyltransferase domain-containing protein [Anaerolineales bacterium]
MMSRQRPFRSVTRSKATAQASYDRLSCYYDWLAASERPFREAGAHLLRVQSGEQVLELGCGTGTVLPPLQQAAASGQVIGLDLSAGMLQVAQRRLGFPVAFVQADAAQLPFAAARFDAVLMSFTLELFDTPEIPVVLAEVRRVLGKNGRFATVTLAQQNSLAVQLYEWFHDKLPNWVDCRPIPTDALLAEAGFHIVTHQRRKLWGLSVDIILAQTHA